MGFLDDAKSMVNRGTAAAERTTKTARLKMQLNDLASRRRDLVMQLGASIYDDVKDKAEFREGRETLFDDIAELDAQRASIEEEIARIEREAAEALEAAQSLTCPQCGAKVPPGGSFCTGCGLSIGAIKEMIAQAQAAQPPVPPTGVEEGLTCAACGAPMREGDLFCMSCGTRREEAPAAEEAESVVEAEVEVEAEADSEPETKKKGKSK